MRLGHCLSTQGQGEAWATCSEPYRLQGQAAAGTFHLHRGLGPLASPRPLDVSSEPPGVWYQRRLRPPSPDTPVLVWEGTRAAFPIKCLLFEELLEALEHGGGGGGERMGDEGQVWSRVLQGHRSWGCGRLKVGCKQVGTPVHESLAGATGENGRKTGSKVIGFSGRD